MVLHTKFSIIIPLYNKKETIISCFNSANNQNYCGNYDVIIVNDGSTDNPEAELLVIESSGGKVFTTINGGVSRARNYGVSKSSGDYILFLDADDHISADYLSRLDLLIKEYPGAGIYGSAISYGIGSKYSSELLLSKFRPPKEIPNLLDCFMEDFYPLSCSSACIKSSILNSIKFDENLFIGEDLDLWLRIGSCHRVIYDGEIYSWYNTAAENRSCHNPKKFSGERDFLLKILFSKAYGFSVGRNFTFKKWIFLRFYMNIISNMRWVFVSFKSNGIRFFR